MLAVRRLLEWYAADGSLAGEAKMPTAELDELQHLFCVSSDDLMYDSWPVGQAQAARVSVLAGVPVELDRYQYFVTCSSPADC